MIDDYVFQNITKGVGMAHWTAESIHLQPMFPDSVLVLVVAPTGFSLGTLVFPSPLKPAFLIITDVFQFDPESEGQSFIIYSLDHPH